MKITEPGIYKELSNEDYHASEGISNSGISLLIPPNCPKLYFHRYLSGKYTPPKSNVFPIGSAVHTLALEPEKFDSLYIEMPNIDRRTKEGKAIYEEYLAKADGKAMLDSETMEMVKEMANSITSHKLFKNLKGDDMGNIEDSIAWTDALTGTLLRTRPDYYNDKIILDVKTTNDIRSNSFSKSILDYGYHRQAAMACDGLFETTGIKYENVVLFVVSKEAPYLVKSYVLTEDAIEFGRKQYLEGAEIYRKCLKNGVWPGYDEIIEDIDLPRWAYPREDIFSS